MFAIVSIKGKQYKVQKGDLVDVDRLQGTEGDSLTLNEVLITSDSDKTTVGQQATKNIKIKAKIVKQFRGKKVEVRRFKSKVRYRRKNGFRPSLTRLEVLSID